MGFLRLWGWKMASEILDALGGRISRFGIRSAADYINGFAGCLNGGACPASLLGVPQKAWRQMMKDAKDRLAYSDQQMVVKEFSESDIPDGGILAFDNILITTRKDRDGDILESSGAKVDPKMPLLWQHLAIHPIGKLLSETGRSKSLIKTRGVIADTELGRDAAVLVKLGALRISHGFQPVRFEAIYDGKDRQTGWHVKELEIYEFSLVSVPANADAEILQTYEKTKSFVKEMDGIRTAFGRDMLKSEAVKRWAKSIYDVRQKTFAVGIDLETKDGYKPPKGVQTAAKRGLEWRREYKRGGTRIGVARARDLSNGKSVSLETVKRMKSYFARHTVDKQADGWNEGEDGFPSAGRIAWELWGGDAGETWAKKIVAQEASDKESKSMATEKDCTCQKSSKQFDPKTVKMYGEYHLAGSYEAVQSALQKSLNRYMMSVDKAIGTYTYCTIMATFDGYAIIGVEQSGTYDLAPYRLSWSMDGDEASWTGNPEKVEMKVTAEIMESSKSLSSLWEKGFKSEDEDDDDEMNVACPDCGYEGKPSEFKRCGKPKKSADARFLSELLTDHKRMRELHQQIGSILEAHDAANAPAGGIGELLAALC